jgi:hypothetical protein
MQVRSFLDRVEHAGGAELVGPALDFPGTRWRPVVGVGHDRVVVLLHLREEWVAVLGGDMGAVDNRKCPAGTEQASRLGVAELRRDPVKGGEGEDGVIPRFPRLPGLEVADLDLGAGDVAACDLRQLRRELDARDRVATPCELDRRLARAGPDLQQARPRLEPRELRQVVEDGGGIFRAGAVVQLRDRAERLAQAFPVAMLRHV